MGKKKSNAELGYTIPVKRRLEPGRYVFGYAKSLTPDKNGQIKVRTSDLQSTSWLGTSVIHVPEGFEIILKEVPEAWEGWKIHPDDLKSPTFKGKNVADKYVAGTDPY